jgi:hypothetical protein
LPHIADIVESLLFIIELSAPEKYNKMREPAQETKGVLVAAAWKR